jgi:hypothetical protein
MHVDSDFATVAGVMPEVQQRDIRTIITGIWNIIAARSQITGSYETTLVVKLLAVLVSALGDALVQPETKPRSGAA